MRHIATVLAAAIFAGCSVVPAAMSKVQDSPRYCNGQYMRANGWDNGAPLYPNGNYVRANGWDNGALLYPDGSYVRKNGWDDGAVLFPNGSYVRANGWDDGALLYPSGAFVRANGWDDGALLYPNGNYFRENGWDTGDCLYENGNEIGSCPASVRVRLRDAGVTTTLRLDTVTTGDAFSAISVEAIDGETTTYYDVDLAAGTITDYGAFCD